MPYKKASSLTLHFISFLIYLQVGFTAAWLILHTLFPKFSFLYLQHIFGVTLYGVDHAFLWQYITYFLTEPIYLTSLIGDAFGYAIKLYMFWIAGTIVFERRGFRSFLIFYLSIGIIGGIASGISLLYWITPFPYMNNFGVILGLFVAAMMLSRDARIYLFNVFPVQLKILVLIILIFSLLQNIADNYLPNLCNIITTSLFAYFYTLIGWKCESPFHALNPFEKKVIALFRRRR